MFLCPLCPEGYHRPPRRQPIIPGSLREQGSGLVGQPLGNLTCSRPLGG